MTIHSSDIRDFRLEVPEYFNFTSDVFEGWASREPERVALVIADADGQGTSSYTFSGLAARANRFANALARRGVKKGDRVLVMLPRSVEWYEALLGLFKAGVIAVPCPTLLTPRDIAQRIEKATPAAVVADAENAGKFDEAGSVFDSVGVRLAARLIGPEERIAVGWEEFESVVGGEGETFVAAERTRSDDAMLLYFTSGTVAYPKMVLHTQASYGIAHEITARFWHDLRGEDLHWTITDTGWAKAAWGCLFGQWTLGARVFLHRSHRFDPTLTLDALERFRVTTFCAPPTVYRMLVQENLGARRFPSLRHCTSAGEPLNPEVMRAWEASTGLAIYDGYGQTETVNIVANRPGVAIRPGSMGKPTPGFEIAVVDEHGTPQEAGVEGQIAVRVRPERPVGLFHGYWGDPAGTRGVFLGDWYLTGDKARVDKDGYFWFVGRADDVIITAGYRVGPFEVENALIEHPAVQEAAAVSSPDEARGEVVKAFVILASGWAGSDELVRTLQQHVRTVTAPYKYPRKIEFVSSLPKTISGKIRRGELKAREWAGR